MNFLKAIRGLFQSGSVTGIKDANVGVVGSGARVDNINYYLNAPLKNNQDLDQEIRAYCSTAESIYDSIPLAGFKTKLKIPIRIEEIFVPLRAIVDRRAIGVNCFGGSEEAEKHLLHSGEGQEISLVDAFRIADRMHGRRGVVILGDPGSGKTTHLKRLLLWCLHGGLESLGLPKDMIPVFLPLRELDDVQSGLDRFVEKQLNQGHLKTPDGFGERLLQRRNLLFLFDGLDEVASEQQRIKVARWINEAVKVYHDCRFVLTCRFAGYSEESQLGPEFLEMHVRPFDAKQAEAFIHNWYQIVETGRLGDKEKEKKSAEEQAEKLIKQLRRPEFRARRVFELTRNPLLLTNLCLVHYDRGNLPNNRARLYSECMDVLLELWKKAIEYPTTIDSKNGRRVLQPAALWLHQEEGRTRASAAELGPVIEPSLKSVGWHHGNALDFLRAIRDESGLLTGWNHDQYGFMHLGFQEYLAAREIRRLAYENPLVLKELAVRFGESWWQEVGLLLLSLDDPSLFVPYMREVIRTPGFIKHGELVDLCLDDAVEVSMEPFLELLEENAEDHQELWRHQLQALQIVARQETVDLDKLLNQMRLHPFEPIRSWVAEREGAAVQTIVIAPRGGYELVRIPGGRFLMGSPQTEEDRYDDEGPVHEVCIAEFYMGRYPVTNEEYGRFLVENSKVKEPAYWGNRQFNQSRQPVVGVSWDDARRYARWAGLLLPSEAQWEYACRAGSSSRFSRGETEADLERVGWYKKNSGDRLHSVGEKEPNDLSLYDMHGNVWEWVEDDYHQNYLQAPADGSAWRDRPRSSDRVIRGGSRGDGARFCRAANRNWIEPDFRNFNLGFRLVLPGQQKTSSGKE